MRTPTLHIDPQHTTISHQDSQGLVLHDSIALGSGNVLPSTAMPPGAAAMEMAIMTVEDAISATWRQPFASPSLYSDDPAIRQLAHLAGLDDTQPSISREAVERLFSRLASMVEGLPASAVGLPLDATLFGSLLILRELMHHTGISTILLPSATRADSHE